MTRNKRAILVAAIVASAAGTGAVALGQSGGGPHDPIYTPNPQAVKPASAVSALTSQVGVFRRSQVVGDRPDDTLMTWQLKGAGANADNGRKVWDDGTNALYLVPASGGVCTVSTDFVATGCVATNDMINGDGIQGVVCSPYMDPGSLEAYGVLPDGVQQVQMHMSDDSTADAPVTNNVFVFSGSKRAPYPLTITWHEGNVDRETSSGLPKDASQTRCATVVTPEAARAWARGHLGAPPKAP